MALLGLGVLVILGLNSPLSAQSSVFTQGYGADEVLERGAIVRLNKDDTTKVSALKYEDMETMHGVVVNPNDAPVTLSSEGQKVFIATGGRYEVLVSTQNGPIAAGDYLTISSLEGIGMKAGRPESHVVGRALEDWNGVDNIRATSQLTDSAGSTRDINIGRVLADISVSRNPGYGPADSGLPNALKRAAESIAGKEVNTARIYIALVIFVICTFVAGTVMYGGVRSGIISIGRNPLSKRSIVRGMVQVVLFGLIIFILGLFGVYLLIKL